MAKRRHLLKALLSDDDKRRFEEVRDELSRSRRSLSIKLSQADVLRILIRAEHQRISENSLPAAANG